MENHLKNETSPYLLQHVENPVDWYPWGNEAFDKAAAEDKPIFLSIGYSTCHWCHVMAHESFEDSIVADILNKHFVSIKVDKEERPDIDSIYMRVCQAFTGSGGWPTSIVMTPEKKPFFAGTYFPKLEKYGQMGFVDLLNIIKEKWQTERKALVESAEEMIAALNKQESAVGEKEDKLIETALLIYKHSFDKQYGGFGDAPKFPTPHNLLFLMEYYERSNDKQSLHMATETLRQMYRGGIYDHIGGGFCRYSTDRYFLAPHFEKMLYDNALLIMAYSKAYELTKDELFLQVAKDVAGYILIEMTSVEGGFYSAQDADSEGVEGKFYLFEPVEITTILGTEAGNAFNSFFDISTSGNFEGKNIPNLLKNPDYGKADFSDAKRTLYEYRKGRYALHLDDKILTAWNGLMIGAMCHLYRVSGEECYLDAAMSGYAYIMDKLYDGESLYVSYRNGQRGAKGFLDDYAYMIFAAVSLYEATFEDSYLDRAICFIRKAHEQFFDEENGGFFLYGNENEQLIMRPKECYDGAMPSGNSMMAYNLARLYLLTEEKYFKEMAKSQLDFLAAESSHYPAGYGMFLRALADFEEVPMKVVVVVKERADLEGLSKKLPLSAVVRVYDEPVGEYRYKDDKTTYYVCKGRTCMAAVNEVEEVVLKG